VLDGAEESYNFMKNSMYKRYARRGGRISKVLLFDCRRVPKQSAA
jgi:hypothetical protein